ncbi:hypothetical protein MNBD_GAMMA20-2192 [hydrothermal vent metagenome]|uniref:Uncharacterized protein n=1 Tax=hydrothermal vent metagenome TaxID=652676 RepID=A0A3B0ZXD5_9ZZZZ
MTNKILKVPKKLKSVTLWVHPEGRVRGSLYLREQSPDHAGPEQPLEVLNQCTPFVVIKREKPDELRFYNMRSIIRVEYEAEHEPSTDIPRQRCQIQMMDGSFITGSICEQLPPARARLLDYLNRTDECFIKIHMDEGAIYLINKAYIIHAHVNDDADDVS